MRLLVLLLAALAEAAAPRVRTAPRVGAVPVLTPAPLIAPALAVPTLSPAIAQVPALQSVSIVQQAVVAPNAQPQVELGNFFDGAGKVSVAPVGVGGSLSAPSVSGKALLQQLHAQTGARYKPHDYNVTSDHLFSTVDNIERNGVRGVVDAYSGVFIPGRGKDGDDYPEGGDRNGDGHRDAAMNVEHIWPQSFFSKSLPMRSDLHHLFTTFVHPNGIRGHLPFGEVRGQGDYQNDAGAKRGQGVFEPPNAVKGKVARAMLYFYTRYHDRNIYNGAYQDREFWNGNLEMFLRWNRLFPPDQDEKNRNDRIEAWQGNRNPYIDDPSLADRVGVEGFRRSGRLERLQVTDPAEHFKSKRQHKHRRKPWQRRR